MKTKIMLDAINGIDEDLIDKYFEIGEEAKRKKSQRIRRCLIKWGTAAACFLLALSVCILPLLDSAGTSGYKSMLALTAYAADGTENSMELNQSFLNSGISGENIFGRDVPTFEFFAAPVENGEDSNIFEEYDIEISYNGKAVNGGDEHIKLTFVVPAFGISGVGRYCIIGWFEEATDIIVSLRDKESGEIVEKMTVNVRYSEAEKAYQMTLIY